MNCNDSGSFQELLWGHLWSSAQCWAQEELANYRGEDPQTPLIRLNANCAHCYSQLHLTITQDLAVHKAMFTPGTDPDSPSYFRRFGTSLRRTGEDEYALGWGDETADQCQVCGYLEAVLEVGLTRICTVCWGYLKGWLNVVADPAWELVDGDPHTTEATKLQVKVAHQSGVIEAKLRTDPQLAADMKAEDKKLRSGEQVDLSHFQARLDAIDLDIPRPVFHIVRGVRESGSAK